MFCEIIWDWLFFFLNSEQSIEVGQRVQLSMAISFINFKFWVLYFFFNGYEKKRKTALWLVQSSGIKWNETPTQEQGKNMRRKEQQRKVLWTDCNPHSPLLSLGEEKREKKPAAEVFWNLFLFLLPCVLGNWISFSKASLFCIGGRWSPNLYLDL